MILAVAAWLILPPSDYPDVYARAAGEGPNNFAVVSKDYVDELNVTVATQFTIIELEGLLPTWSREVFLQVDSRAFPAEDWRILPLAADGNFAACTMNNSCTFSITRLAEDEYPDFIANAEPLAADTYRIAIEDSDLAASMVGIQMQLPLAGSGDENPYRTVSGPYAYYQGPFIGAASRGAPQITVCYSEMMGASELPLRVDGAQQSDQVGCNGAGSYAAIIPQSSTAGESDALRSFNLGSFYAVTQSINGSNQYELRLLFAGLILGVVGSLLIEVVKPN